MIVVKNTKKGSYDIMMNTNSIYLMTIYYFLI